MRQKQRGCDGARRAEVTTALTSSVSSTVLAAIAALAWAAAGCGSGSNAEVGGGGAGGAPGNPDGGGAAGTNGGGAAGTPGGAAGTPGGAAGSTGAAGSAGTGGASSGGTGGSAGGCPALAAFSQAEHIVMNVTWPNTIGTTGGTGQVHVWAKTTFTASGNDLVGTSQACGSLLPPTGLNLLAGGGSVLIQIPDATWDLPSMPRFQFTATQTGWSAGSTINYTSTALIGLTLTNPATDAWPGTITTAVDADSDTKTGYTAVPAATGGRVLPPTSLNTTANRADRVYLATRNVFMVTATRNACDHAAGPVTVVHFDSHVVGCHVSGGADCTTAQSNFVDQNRTIYAAGTSTIELKVVPAAATCADVRAALPMM
jgi:hypothetical protein